MGKTLYFECLSGISGDMTVAALLDLGADEKVLLAALASLPLDGYKIKISRVVKGGLDACDFMVEIEGEQKNHDYDMAYLHGIQESRQETSREGNGILEKTHHEHRHLADIEQIIEQAALTERAKSTAKKIFRILAEAEAKAHGTDVEQVHFHEVGAVDSIIDIIAAAVCLDNLDITEVIIPVLYEGTGTVRCQHGILPIPVPAVTNIAAQHQLSLHIMEVEGEFVTPTGAAIAAAVRTSSQLPERFVIRRTGQGAGKRSYEKPSILRAMLIEEEKEPSSAGTETEKKENAAGRCIYKLESNMDDCTGEALGYLMERLFAAGAKDVYYTPVLMKKNRPAYELSVLCDQTDIYKLQNIIFEETTTIGIRRVEMERTVLSREIRMVDTAFGPVHVKVCTLPGGDLRAYPEYNDIKQLCKSSGKSFQDVFRMVMKIMEK